MNAKTKLTIAPDKCKSCGLCIAVCTKDLLTEGETLNGMGYHPVELKQRNKCNSCGLCVLICPDLALFLEKEAG